MSISLVELSTGSTGVIERVGGHGAFRKRITEMGFVKGQTVRAIKTAPLLDPVEYEIMGYRVSLRRSEALGISVVEARLREELPAMQPAVARDGGRRVPETVSGQAIRVAFIGNPNSGKTTLFNRISGLHERVGNYGGVTVEAKEAMVTHGARRLALTDLPGTYSLTEYTPEELFVREHMLRTRPDVVVNVIDASSLERNLFLTTQLIDMDVKIVIALNMFDEIAKSGARLDWERLGTLLGMPVVPTVGVTGTGVQDLLDTIVGVHEGRDSRSRRITIHLGETVEGSVERIQGLLGSAAGSANGGSTRYRAITHLGRDTAGPHDAGPHLDAGAVNAVLGAEASVIMREYGERAETVIADKKYGFIAGLLRETYVAPPDLPGAKKRSLDDVLTHRWFGFPVFFLFMWLMFQATFTLGEYPQEWIEHGVAFLGDTVSHLLPDGAVHDLLVDGLIGGVGGVIVFLPNILILFFFISVMEDTGYMARVSFIMDRLMHGLGLHGKSFIPLLIGFGCNVPAVMATRTLESRKDRVVTMLITPFMSCSARLPVFVLLISAFFPRNQALVLLSIYAIGIVMAIMSALALNRIFFAKQDVPFVIELPPYRIPTARNAFLHMWHKGSQYLKKMGGPILAASILVWALGYYPREAHFTRDYDALMAQVQRGNEGPDQAALLADLALQKESERVQQSYIGQLGHVIEPAIRPLGFDWKIGVSILTGVAAKEIVVSSMGILYQAEMDADEESGGLREKLQAQTFTSGDRAGERVFSQLTAYALMVFVLIYFPCVAVVAAIRKEAGRGWAVFSVVYTTAVAWIAAYGVTVIGRLFV